MVEAARPWGRTPGGAEVAVECGRETSTAATGVATRSGSSSQPQCAWASQVTVLEGGSVAQAAAARNSEQGPALAWMPESESSDHSVLMEVGMEETATAS